MNMTPQEYTAYLKLDEIYNFIKVMLWYIKNGNSSSYLLDLEAKRHLHILEEIDRADFEGGRYDDAPF